MMAQRCSNGQGPHAIDLPRWILAVYWTLADGRHGAHDGQRDGGSLALRPQGHEGPEHHDGPRYPQPHDERVDVDTEEGAAVGRELAGQARTGLRPASAGCPRGVAAMEKLG